MPADAAPPLTASPPAAWTPTPALTAALARLLLQLTKNKAAGRVPGGHDPPSAAAGLGAVD
jgi:hypothetical protein